MNTINTNWNINMNLNASFADNEILLLLLQPSEYHCLKIYL